MNKTKVMTLFLVALALFWWQGGAACLAYYPPLTAITGPTVSQVGDITTVSVSIYNPGTQKDVPYDWTIAGGAGAIAIDQTYNYQGMVAWRVHDVINNKYMIVGGVYDPNPDLGWQFFTNWGTWMDPETNIRALNDGVLLYESSQSAPSASTVAVYFATYDPGGEFFGPHPFYVGWRSFSHTIGSFDAGNILSYIVKDGVAAFLYYSPSWSFILSYGIYDGKGHWWSTGYEYPASNPGMLQVTNATLTWSEFSGDQKRGYDYTDTSWKAGIDTKVMAHFVFSPFAPKSNKPVWFTDMSIGATSWSWDLGDGGASTNRSLYHKYTKSGNYSVQLDVTGPVGSDSNTQTVAVTSPGLPGQLLLLMDN